MKKTINSLMAFAAVAMTVASCSSDIENDALNTPAAGKVAMTFSATHETSGTTSRTALGEDNKVEWQNTDIITVWDGTAVNPFTVTPDGEDATLADISGTVTAGAKSFTAVYPDSIGKHCTYTADGITGLVIPVTQTATRGSYDPYAAVMVAETTDETLAFKHVCSFLKITTDAAYNKIEVSVAEGAIADTFSVAPSTGVTTAVKGAKTITLKPANSETSIADGTYYIAIAPGQVSGLSVRCYKDNSYKEKLKSGSVTFTRAASVDLGNTDGWETSPYEFVDLGLSVKWATMNVGATSPEGYGDYFAWGETEPYYTGNAQAESPTWKEGKTGYDWANYKWMAEGKSDNFGITKYTLDDGYINGIWYNDEMEFVGDGKITLELADDAANANWGGSWRMPTKDEIDELVNNTYNGWTDNYNGAKGYIFYKKVEGKTSFGDYTTNDVHVFLPAAGCRLYSIISPGYGGYWSSSLSNLSCGAMPLVFSDPDVSLLSIDRFGGLSVRAVCP